MGEADPNNFDIISILYPPDYAERPYVSSVDTIKAVEFLVKPHEGKLSDAAKKRIRRNIDSKDFHPETLKINRNSKSLSWIWELPGPRPVHINSEIKILPWLELGPALIKLMARYVRFFSSISRRVY